VLLARSLESVFERSNKCTGNYRGSPKRWRKDAIAEDGLDAYLLPPWFLLPPSVVFRFAQQRELINSGRRFFLPRFKIPGFCREEAEVPNDLPSQQDFLCFSFFGKRFISPVNFSP